MPSTPTSRPTTAPPRGTRELIAPRENTETLTETGPTEAPCGTELPDDAAHDEHVVTCTDCQDIALHREALDSVWELASSYLSL